MEYFIIDEGKFWDEILAILKQKAMDGVKVKIIYDDFGCVTLPRHYDRKLKEYGIEAFRFNKLRPALIVQMNNRDHRKICVIDNRVAFTGGVNLADEYVNLIKRFGYWKDSAIMIQGKAVWSFTVMFLGMYSYLKGDDTLDYLQYKLPADDIQGSGCFLPFSDSPTDNEHTCLGMHLNIVNHAADYIYIDTPYLILNESMTTSLILAAKNGVDVRILLPHIPDKIITNQITKGNYAPLIRAGVRIYEYTPGFNHAKNILADDKIGLVGSINTDYRSYYLHFEDGIILSDKAVISKMKQDFLDSVAKSKEITIDDISRTRLPVRLFRGSLKAFMPLF
jgi:cardiolipin synthase